MKQQQPLQPLVRWISAMLFVFILCHSPVSAWASGTYCPTNHSCRWWFVVFYAAQSLGGVSLFLALLRRTNWAWGLALGFGLFNFTMGFVFFQNPYYTFFFNRSQGLFLQMGTGALAIIIVLFVIWRSYRQQTKEPSSLFTKSSQQKKS